MLYVITKNKTITLSIFRSIGNFIFNSNIERTFALELENITQDGADDIGNMTFKLIPAFASNAKTQLMDDAKAASLYSYLNSISNGVSIGDDGAVILTTDADVAQPTEDTGIQQAEDEETQQAEDEETQQ